MHMSEFRRLLCFINNEILKWLSPGRQFLASFLLPKSWRYQRVAGTF